jgi:hypothetical protein
MATIDDDAPVCYLCLDGGAEEPLRRDCASKSKQASDTNEFTDPWKECPSCHQDYQNKFAVDIAAKFVSFVRRQFPSDTQGQVEALHLKLCALNSMFERLQPVQKRELGVTANVMLSLIDRLKGDTLQPERYSQMEADAYGVHGRIALNEGTEESARKAVVHLENQLEVFEAIGNDQGIAVAKRNIAIAKSKYADGNNNEELLKASQELYEMRIAKLGEENEYTIIAGKIYSIGLRKANRGDEARELLTKLLAVSKQVLGPDHKTTKGVKSELMK